MAAGRDDALVAIVLSAVALLVLYFGIGSGVSLYAIFGGIAVVVALTCRRFLRERGFLGGGVEAGRDAIKESLYYRMRKISSAGKASSREKKMLAFYLLNLLENKGTLDLSEVAAHLDVSIYDLNEVVGSLHKHGVVKTMYLPMKTLPIITGLDRSKSMHFREQIFESLAGMALFNNNRRKEFIGEVNEYIGRRERKPGKKPKN